MITQSSYGYIMISCFRQAKSIQSFIFREKKKKNLEKIFSKFISVEYLKVMKFEDTNYNQLLKYKFDCSKNIYCLFSHVLFPYISYLYTV